MGEKEAPASSLQRASWRPRIDRSHPRNNCGIRPFIRGMRRTTTLNRGARDVPESNLTDVSPDFSPYSFGNQSLARLTALSSPQAIRAGPDALVDTPCSPLRLVGPLSLPIPRASVL